MPHSAIPARLATPVAEVEHDTARWPGCPGREEHRAERTGERRPITGTGPGGVRQGWDGACTSCAESVPWEDPDVDVFGGSGNKLLYDTPTGRLEPGCIFWVDQHPDHDCFSRWSNCDGRHLHAVLPNGHQWDIDSRAANCGSPDDTEHRCWVRHGDPPAVHVDKAGMTCSAGAGSIAAGDYHGFLHNGVFTAG